jgi:hypothetical protein
METLKLELVSALMAGQPSINLNNMEIILKPLKRDTQLMREREALKVAGETIEVMFS